MRHIITTALSRPLWIDTADVNNDGFLDVLAASFQNGRIVYLLNDKSGGFGPPQNVSAGSAGADGGRVASIIAADINSDGGTDLITTSFATDELILHLQSCGED